MMSGSRTAVVIVLLLASACSRPSTDAATATETAAPARPRHAIKGPEDDRTERDNLLNYAKGAVVVSRSGEFALWSSSLQAIDGDPETCWFPPPHEARQWMIAALPAQSRVEQVGLSNVAAISGAISSVTFESSMDGVAFSPLGAIDIKARKNGALVPVHPTEARYIRATLNGDPVHENLSLCSLQIRGSETAKRAPDNVTGCWRVNGSTLALGQEGDHVSGQLDGPKPTLIDGGSDGRFLRFVWTRDREFGYGALSIEDAGHHLSGRIWHEEPIPIFAGEAWFGERVPCAAKTVLGGSAVASTFFQRAQRFPLYGLRTAADGAIDVPRSVATLRALDGLIRAAGSRHLTLEAHEFRQRNAAADRAFAAREIASLRGLLEGAGVPLGTTVLTALGRDNPRQDPRTADQRALYSCVEVVIPVSKTLAR